jgi:hypothetical protein
MGQPAAKRRLRRPTCKWDNNSSIYLKKEDRFVWTDAFDSKEEPVSGPIEDDNQSLGSLK